MRLVTLLFAAALAACSSAAPAGTTSSGSGATASSSSSSSSSSSGSTSGGSTTGTSGSPGSSGSTGGAPMLTFAFTGDTRPDNCDDFANYPTPVITGIAQSMKLAGAQFALDTGDHLKVCKSDSSSQAASSAQQQLSLYAGAIAALGKPFYLTMGNHECADNKSLCDTSDAVLSVFMGFVQRQVATAQPYYTFDVATPHGTATFVVVADTAWDASEASWLESALTHGDGSAYTIIAKHVPTSNTTDFATNADEVQLIERHRFALLVDSHAHLYAHSGESGREVTLGLGGAPLDDPSSPFGYGLVQQQPDGTLKVSAIDASTGAAFDAFSVGPN